MSENERKEKEITFLKKFVDDKSCSDKQSACNALKVKTIDKISVPLTKSDEKVIVFGKNRLIYTYLRFDSRYEIHNASKLTRVSSQNGLHIKNIFFNSGMSAISCLIAAIEEIKKCDWVFQDNIYFETYKILAKIKHRQRKRKIYFFDSISPDFDVERILKTRVKHSDIIVIDSTCVTDNGIDKITQKFQGSLIFVVKSLTKLDMLATEYSRMGCLTVVVSTQMDKQMAKDYGDILSGIYSTRIIFNCSPAPFDFFPCWENDEFFKLNQKRLEKIKENSEATKYFFTENPKFKVLLPNHKLFLLIFPQKFYERDELVQKCKTIAETLQKNHNIRYCGSFGFDFIAIDTYIDVASKKQTIRLSLNDCSDDQVQVFAKDFEEVLIDNI